MPLLTPSRRWQQAYYPFKKRRFSERIEEYLERTFKGIVWGCRMCGNCLLQETAFICPMACPKGLRNGPCGGSTAEHCCVDESRPCIWYEIYSRAEKLGRLEKLLEVLPPLDWDKTGTSALRDVYLKLGDAGPKRVAKAIVRSSAADRKEKWSRFFKEIRQPDWWDGDDQTHPPAEHEPVSHLEDRLRSGGFTVTCEVIPPLSQNWSAFEQKLHQLKGWVDSVNITDSASAMPRVSPYACALKALEIGIEPILQLAGRDRTRLSLQTDLLGASISGIRNILLITGDHPNKGNRPFSRTDIWDYDSVQALWIARKMRDESHYLDGRKIKYPPSYFIGAAVSPNASKPGFQAIRDEKKLNAGAQFFQSNIIFDIHRFEEYLSALDKRNLLNRMHLIAGIAPLRSLQAAYLLQSLPGIDIPESIMRRLSDSKDFQAESSQICLEIIEKLKALQGVQGIHFMAVSDMTTVKQLIMDSDLLEITVNKINQV